ncbi:hypothetical protein K490DRAFT_65137 [Saccharata proteae CBS 121410]|uniref:Uncharacterized protein n=1 Tax=Saccharata proteae CBS 121410 TaxID=1314787 RepID=A0A9P4LX77_9PEZI|nr:hypothetical protein K490DRAFT_65137 [Saccharata proteae CBS 121410]
MPRTLPKQSQPKPMWKLPELRENLLYKPAIPPGITRLSWRDDGFFGLEHWHDYFEIRESGVLKLAASAKPRLRNAQIQRYRTRLPRTFWWESRARRRHVYFVGCGSYWPKLFYVAVALSIPLELGLFLTWIYCGLSWLVFGAGYRWAFLFGFSLLVWVKVGATTRSMNLAAERDAVLYVRQL